MLRSRSLATRLGLGAIILLGTFALGIALTINTLVRQELINAQEDRMRGLVFNLLGATNVSRSGELRVSMGRLPEHDLEQADRDRWAAVMHSNGELGWHSRSVPPHQTLTPSTLPPGTWDFHYDEEHNRFEMRYPVVWLPDNQRQYSLEFIVSESDERLHESAARLSQVLLGALVSVSVLLLMLMLGLQRWAMRPFQRLSVELENLQRGTTDALTGTYPDEVQPLVGSLNTLIVSERARQSRYRNALGDLAHSLKTPIAITTSLVEELDEHPHRYPISEQLSRLEGIISHQLQRAATTGGKTLRIFTDLRPIITRLSNALGKLYRQHNIEIDLPTDTRCPIDEADAMELLGNLMENACKYSDSIVRLRLSHPSSDSWLIEIEDDGPGFPKDHQRILQRGVRADTATEGQGIGLAMVCEMIDNYPAQLTLSRSDELGGAKVSIIIRSSAAN